MLARRSLLTSARSLLLVPVLLLGGCAPAAQQPAQPKPPAAAPTTASGAQQAPVPATPTAAAAAQAPAQASASAEWDRMVAAAKQEGKLALSAPANTLWRENLTAFQKEYPEITVEYTGQDSRDFWPRLFQEREGDQFLWDVRIGGPDPQVFAAKERGILDPVKPLLMRPEVMDESKWLGGWNTFYADKEKRYLPGFLANVSKAVYVNREFIPDPEIRTETDLLDPKYKGKIVIQDPRGGAGLGFLATFLHVHNEPFVRGLLQQDLIVSSDNRQIAEWVVRGRYPIGIGLRNYDLLGFQREGLGASVQPLDDPKALPLSIGSGGIQLINRAPHPNATAVFINWLLTPSVQTVLTKAVEQNSLRTDVPPGAPDEVPAPGETSKYVAHQTEELLGVRTRAVQIAGEYLK